MGMPKLSARRWRAAQMRFSPSLSILECCAAKSTRASNEPHNLKTAFALECPLLTQNAHGPLNDPCLNSQSRCKGADQRKMTDPAISAFLGNTGMGRDDVTKLSQLLGFL